MSTIPVYLRADETEYLSRIERDLFSEVEEEEDEEEEEKFEERKLTFVSPSSAPVQNLIDLTNTHRKILSLPSSKKETELSANLVSTGIITPGGKVVCGCIVCLFKESTKDDVGRPQIELQSTGASKHHVAPTGERFVLPGGKFCWFLSQVERKEPVKIWAHHCEKCTTCGEQSMSVRAALAHGGAHYFVWEAITCKCESVRNIIYCQGKIFVDDQISSFDESDGCVGYYYEPSGRCVKEIV